MSDGRKHAEEIGNSMVGLSVCRARRGVGSMMTLDAGEWRTDLGRGERSLWVRGAVWRVDVAGRIAANEISSSDEEIDAVLSGLKGKRIVDVVIDDDGGVRLRGVHWSLLVFAIEAESVNWVLFDESDRSASSGPNARFETALDPQSSDE